MTRAPPTPSQKTYLGIEVTNGLAKPLYLVVRAVEVTMRNIFLLFQQPLYEAAEVEASSQSPKRK